MLKASVTPAEVIELLNGALALDREAVSALVAARVPCNEALAYHPTIQTGRVAEDPQAEFEVGILGILNGIFGISAGEPDGIREGYGCIEAHVEDGVVTEFRRTTTKPEVAE